MQTELWNDFPYMNYRHSSVHLCLKNTENSSLRCGHAPHLLRRHHYHGLSGQGVDRKVLKRHGRHHLHYRGCQSEASTVCQLVETSNMTNKQQSSLLICTLRSDFEGGRNVVLQPEKNLSLQNHFSATLKIRLKGWRPHIGHFYL